LPDSKTIARFYGEDFNYKWYRNNLANKLYDSKKRYNEYSKFIGKNCLDFGGGIGYFSLTCRGHGVESETYDPYASNNVSKALRWDSVVSSHVLEHMPDPKVALRQMVDFLKPGGILILNVPNADSSSYRKYGFKAVWAQPPIMHLYHFTRVSLLYLAESLNLEVISVSATDRWDANFVCDVAMAPFTKLLDRMYFVCDAMSLGKIHSFFVGALYRRLGLWFSRKYFCAEANQELTLIARQRLAP
jgi:SAM-dependent methyltransferase